MGDKINSACLSTEDRGFVSYEQPICELKTDAWTAILPFNLSRIPKKGQRLRITNWHHGIPVKIEARHKEERIWIWETIFERSELPEGFHCLAGCGTYRHSSENG